MLRIRGLTVIGCLLVVGALFAGGESADVKLVLRKAMAAHGGEEKLTKYKAAVTKFKGTLEILGVKADISGEAFVQRPDRAKTVMNLDIKGKTVVSATVLNGQKLWVSLAGRTREIDDDDTLKVAHDEMIAEGASGLLPVFLEEPYALNAIGEVSIRGNDAIGIRVGRKGHKDIVLYFDKKTFLLVKAERRALDRTTGQEFKQEKLILSYQEKDGMKVPKRVETLKDGKTFMDIEITEARAFEKLDDIVFAKP